ncbi:hypothetical protein [Streptomyces mirabilis]
MLTTDGTRKRIRVYGATRREAADELTEKMANSTLNIRRSLQHNPAGGLTSSPPRIAPRRRDRE